jgi:hypothetical protein
MSMSGAWPAIRSAAIVPLPQHIVLGLVVDHQTRVPRHAEPAGDQGKDRGIGLGQTDVGPDDHVEWWPRTSSPAGSRGNSTGAKWRS